MQVALGAPRLRGLQAAWSSCGQDQCSVALGAPRLRGLQGMAASHACSRSLLSCIGSAPLEGTASAAFALATAAWLELHWEHPA